MKVTRRYWQLVGVGATVIGLAIIFDRPILLIGAAGIGTWLITEQYRFLRQLQTAVEELTVEQTVSRSQITTDDATVVSVGIAGTQTPLDVSARFSPPIVAEREDAEPNVINLGTGASNEEIQRTISWPIAGTFQFDPVEITLTDSRGLFQERIKRGPTPSVTVEPRAPRNVHVGRGGEQLATGYGDHSTGLKGSGLTPAEIRKYVPGDDTGRIDWKATARLDDPHVREYEAETDRRTVLLIDHRSSVGTGPDGERKLDYLRAVALGFVNSAQSMADPLGIYTVGDEGVTKQLQPDADKEQYRRIRTTLHDLAPTPAAGHRTVSSTDTERRVRTPGEAGRIVTRLREEQTQFGEVLEPYFRTTETYVQRIENDPLFETARTHLDRLRGTLWTVIFTDDTHREEVRETVKAARRGDDHVMVFIAPTVLFEQGGLAEIETAYQRYLAFEEFRRELERLPRVVAFEIGPGDRLEAVLSARRDRRRSATTGGSD